MRVYIVRHGEAGSAASDELRALTPKGRADVSKLAETLARKGVHVAEVWHSPLRRAAETARILVDAGRIGSDVQERDGLLPEDDPAEIVEALELMYDDVCIVGHMPFVSSLVSMLVAGRAQSIVRFETATMACLEREALGAWRLAWQLSPAII
jgi:phosphohistidine phosphatase